MDDADAWKFIAPDDLWIYDKLILSKKLGYNCGPAGVVPAEEGIYIVRPCVNFRMMGRGASIQKINKNNESFTIPDGFFWCEIFAGRHLSFDYYKGKQVLAVEGFRDDPNRLDRFSRWEKIDLDFEIPNIFTSLINTYDWLNLECIGDKVIEVHLRYNDDFEGHSAKTIIPIWKDNFKESECGDRIGFLLK